MFQFNNEIFFGFIMVKTKEQSGILDMLRKMFVNNLIFAWNLKWTK